MLTATKDRSLDTFADTIITRTFQSKVDKRHYAVIDAGFGHYGNFPDFAWSGDSEAEAIAGCGRWIRRHSEKDATLGFGAEGLERLKSIWARNERMVALGVDRKALDRGIRDSQGKFDWGLASYEKINGDFFKEMDGEKLEGILQVGLASLKGWLDIGADTSRIDEWLGDLKVEFVLAVATLRCEATDETNRIFDRRIAEFTADLAPEGLKI